ncbi:MAG: DUF4013 domain-containing protein [Anaerolineae bacterium]|nr:DUF4013 domain-containing protein [Anaerolineae bacterium]
MDIGRSFSYITEDEDWLRKVLIGGLLTLIPVVGQFYGIGYALEALRNVIHGRELPLPEPVEEFGEKLVQGLLAWVILLIWSLPLIIVGACASGGAAAFAEGIRDQDTGTLIGTFWGLCFGCLGLILGIAVGLVAPFVLATYAETGEFGAALKVGTILRMMWANIGPAFIALLVVLLAGMLASIAGTILCGIGLFATMFYAQLVAAYLYGTLYAQAKPAVS